MGEVWFPIMSARNHGEYEAHQDIPPVPPEAKPQGASESVEGGFQLPTIKFSPRIVGAVHCALCLIAHSCYISASGKNSSPADNIAIDNTAAGNLISAGIILSTTSGIFSVAEIPGTLAGTIAAFAVSSLIWGFVTMCHVIDVWGHANDDINAAVAFTLGAIITQVILFVLAVPSMKVAVAGGAPLME